MNSVIQQLYMIPPIRNGILAIEGTGTDVDDDMSGDEKQENEVQQPHKVTALSPGIKRLKFGSSNLIHSQYICWSFVCANNNVITSEYVNVLINLDISDSSE